jgi:hypothetical protein
MHACFVSSDSREVLSCARFSQSPTIKTHEFCTMKTGTPTGAHKCKPHPPNDFRNERTNSAGTKRNNPGRQPSPVPPSPPRNYPRQPIRLAHLEGRHQDLRHGSLLHRPPQTLLLGRPNEPARTQTGQTLRCLPVHRPQRLDRPRYRSGQQTPTRLARDYHPRSRKLPPLRPQTNPQATGQ